MVTGHCKNGGIRAGGYFGGYFGISKLLLGASAGPRGPPRKGQTLRPLSFPLRSTRGTGSLHFCMGLCGPEAFYTVNMRRFETSHGTLRKWSDSGLRPSGGHPRSTSKLQKTFSTKPLKLQGFFEWRPDRWTHFPWPLRVASRRPEEASRDDPDHLRMQKSVFSKLRLFLQEN